MDSRPLPGQLPTRVRAGRHLPEYLVLPIAGGRCGGVAYAYPRTRPGSTALWLHPELAGWSSQASVDTLSPALVGGFELLRTDAAEMAVPT